MTDPEIDPLAPDLRALVAVERARAAPSAEGKARVAARLESMLVGPGGPSGGGGGAGGSEGGSAGRDAAPRATAVTAPFGGVARMIGVFVAGAVTGGVLVFALREPRVEVVERVAPVPPAATSVSGSGSGGATEATTAYAPQATRATDTDVAAPDAGAAAVDNGGAAQPRADSLAAERALLDPARTALGRGDGASALDAVHKHEARFANGKLAEEREAIAVQALVVSHRMDEARARAARFQQRYPGSVLAPSVAAALETAP